MGSTIAGLMCIPPADEPPAPHFALTAKIAHRNGLKLLSMGMSADFPTAIAFGATHVRVGTRDFRGAASGKRPKNEFQFGSLGPSRASSLQQLVPAVSATQPAVGARPGAPRE